MKRRPAALAIFAHPDDESWICAGTLIRLRQAGFRTSLVVLTRGEHCRQQPSRRVSIQRMAQIRTKELQQAARILRINDLTLERYSDGDLSELPRRRLTAAIFRLLRKEQPAVLLTFAPDGVSGHSDHAAVAAAVRAAVAKLKVAPDVFEHDFSDQQRRQLRLPLHRRKWKLQSINVAPQLPRKLRAINCHASQFIALGRLARLSKKQQIRLLSVEYVRAGVPLKNFLDVRR